MIPYFKYTVIPVGALHIQVWGLLVAAGIVVAVAVGAREARKRGLDPGTFVDLATWVLIPAFIVARLVHVFVYAPTPFFADPFRFFRMWEGGVSSFGGFLGAGIGAWLFVRRRKISFDAYADVACYALPLGYGIGRIGCFLIHDHPGTLSHSLLAVQYPGGARLDHGLLLALVGFAIFAFFLLWKKYRPHPRQKAYLPAFMIIYGAARFMLDFWRAWDLPGSDVRWLWLTPAQYGSIILVALGIVALVRHRRASPSVLPVGRK
jgi:phosphatidylglycerol:prolipoprotein diacylglycerol transferase